MSLFSTRREGASWALTRLIVGHVFLHASMSGMRLASPLLALKLGHSALHVGVLLALYSLTQVFLALPAGRYADRHGLRRPMGMGVVVAEIVKETLQSARSRLPALGHTVL